MFAPHGNEQPPTKKGAPGLCPGAFTAKRRTSNSGLAEGQTPERLVVVANDRAAAARAVGRATHPAPARPEDEREQGADRADGKQDPADRVQLEAADRGVDRPDQDGAGCHEQKTDSDTHFVTPFADKRRGNFVLCRENGRSAYLDTASF